MPFVRFTGRLLPSGVVLTIPRSPTFLLTSRVTHTPFNLWVETVDSVVEARCEGDELHPDDYIDFYQRSQMAARMIVDIIAFKGGLGLTVVLDKFFNPEGAEETFHFIDKRLEETVTSFDIPAHLGQVAQLVFGDDRLGMALHDLITGFTSPDYLAINYARAIETLRHMIAPADADTKASWAAMRTALNIDRAYIQLVTESSIKPRHGQWEEVGSDELRELSLRAWTIMNRYLAYRLQGNAPLADPLYPLLTG